MNKEQLTPGVELIAAERIEQIEKHNRSIENDIKYNTSHQLSTAARRLAIEDGNIFRDFSNAEIFCPENWDEKIWLKMVSKPYKERLIIAGALIAAEIDRINKTSSHENTI